MYNPNEDRYGESKEPYDRRPSTNTSPMGVASISCAILALFCILTGFFALVFGSLAILFSRLSNTTEPRSDRPARYGRLVGLIACIVGAAVITFSMVSVVREYGSFENYYNSYLDEIEETYGIDLGDRVSFLGN